MPLLTNPGPDGRYRDVEGLVSFLVGCSSQAWFSDVVDLAGDPPPAYPEIDRSTAAAALRADPAGIRLAYTVTPFSPEWRSGTACVPATRRSITGCPAAPPGGASPPG